MKIPLTPQEIAKRVFECTVAIEMELANGNRIPLGSGFFVAQDFIATNLHVVHGSVGNCYAKLINQTGEYLIEGYTHIDVEHDLIILKIKSLQKHVLQCSDSDHVQVGDIVYAVGNPQGLQGTFSDGIISGIRRDNAGLVIQITAPTSQGSSGGPVLNSRGEVIGVSFMNFINGQNLNFAIPSNDLRQLLSKPANLMPLFITKFGVITEVNNSLRWEETATYTFSLHNRYRWPIKDVSCLVHFYLQNQHVGFDLVNISDPIPPGEIRDITRRSIFDTPYLKDINSSGWTFADRIAFVIPSVIRNGEDPNIYNMIDPIANQPIGHNRITIIDYKVQK